MSGTYARDIGVAAGNIVLKYLMAFKLSILDIIQSNLCNHDGLYVYICMCMLRLSCKLDVKDALSPISPSFSSMLAFN